MFTRVAVGRARVVREVRAAGPLLAALRAPTTFREPWLTAVLNQAAAHRPRARPVAVVVEAHRQGRPEAVAFLSLRRRGLTTVVTVLGDGAGPVPGGRPPARLPARDPAAAALLAEGIVGLLGSLRLPWTLRLAGLPLGDPTAAALAARLPTAVQDTARSARIVDDLDERGAVERSRDPRTLERWLPALLEHAPDGRSRDFLRSTARLHAAIGRLEVAIVPGDGVSGDGVSGDGVPGSGVPGGGTPRAGLLTLLDGGDRWPWWGFAGGGLRTEMGAPLVGLTVPARGWPPASVRPRPGMPHR